MLRQKWFLFLILTLFTLSCERRPGDLRLEGQSIMLTLIQELERVHSHQDLVKAFFKLQKLFNQLADLLIEIHALQQQVFKSIPRDLTEEEQELNDRLKAEIYRIYNLEGGKETIEKAQEQALNHLKEYFK